MAWFRKEKKPRLPRHEKHEIPPDAWEKCDQCGHTDLREKFVRNLNVCPNCGHHRRIRASEYAALVLDEGTAEETEIEIRSTDPLGFPDYEGRLKKATTNAGEGDAMLTFTGQLGGMPVCLAVMDFAFMGGSMGSVVGEKIARLGQLAIERKYPLIIISASGGARMQEGVLSLMQMAKAAAILSQLSERRIPYVSILTNPTTGGVSASFSMLGDAILAEPACDPARQHFAAIGSLLAKAGLERPRAAKACDSAHAAAGRMMAEIASASFHSSGCSVPPQSRHCSSRMRWVSSVLSWRN